jgi:hypothetical protein
MEKLSDNPEKDSFLSNLFFDKEQRVRALWRILFFTATYALLIILLAGITFLIPGNSPNTDFRILLFVNGVLSTVSAVLAGWIAGRLCEGLPFNALGINFNKSTFTSFSAGFLYGILAYIAAALIAVAFGNLEFTSDAGTRAGSILQSWAFAAMLLSAPAAFEEVLFRGYILQTFVRNQRSVFGVIFSSVLFAAVHSFNPNVSQIALANTFLAGVWFATAYLVTKNLWLPFGIHLAWNWTQIAVFGSEISGFSRLVPISLFNENDGGPDWLTGGNYGIEGGLACTIVISIAIAINVALVYRKGKSPQ